MTTTPYTTNVEVRLKLGLTQVDAALDAQLDNLILGVSALFDTYVFGPGEYGFVGESIVEIHDGGQPWVILRRLLTDFPASRGTTAVKEDGASLIAGQFSIDEFPANTIYRIDSNGDLQNWAKGVRNIEVTYTGAYLAAPQDVVRACDEETARAYLAGNSPSAQGGFLGITQKTPEAGTVLSYAVDDFTLTTLRMLDGYRKRLKFY